MQVYLDNAAATSLDPEVLESMWPHMCNVYANPSAVHRQGRQAKVVLERARKTTAELLSVSPAEIYFTSGGTESNNLALQGMAAAAGVRHAITSPLEHQAVLRPLVALQKRGALMCHWVDVDTQGSVQHDHLERLLQKLERPVLVSLMHANNEIGNWNDLSQIGALCRSYDALLHTDAVQTIGHCPVQFKDKMAHCASGSAHKFHGPKGVGLLYVQSGTPIAASLLGGDQERGLRAGTESVAGAVGLSKALEIAYRDMEKNKSHILLLKKHAVDRLRSSIPGVQFLGKSATFAQSLHTILSIEVPFLGESAMLSFGLDIRGVSASSGSACGSGSLKTSHVLSALARPQDGRAAVRFSFSKHNTLQEVDFAVAQMATLCRASNS